VTVELHGTHQPQAFDYHKENRFKFTQIVTWRQETVAGRSIEHHCLYAVERNLPNERTVPPGPAVAVMREHPRLRADSIYSAATGGQAAEAAVPAVQPFRYRALVAHAARWRRRRLRAPGPRRACGRRGEAAKLYRRSTSLAAGYVGLGPRFHGTGVQFVPIGLALLFGR
jgi:hypothetical protein